MTVLVVFAAASAAAIVLIWLGYPLLVWCAARIFGRPIRPDHAAALNRTVSVILATRDDVSVLTARIANLIETDHPANQLQIVVALDADGAQATEESLTRIDARVLVVRVDIAGGKAATLNAGVRAATGEVLVMADAQQRFDRRTIPELVAALEDQRFGAVSGALSLGGSGSSPVHRYWVLEKWLRYNESKLHSSVGVTGAVYAMRRVLWPIIPDETLLDDVFVPMSLVLRGQRVGFTYAARARDVRAFDAAAETARKTRTLTGVLQLRQKLPGLLSPRRNPIWAQFVAHKLLRLTTPVFVGTGVVSTLLLAVVLFARAQAQTQLLVATALVLPLLIPGVRHSVIGTMRWIFAMQRATTRATVNGMRARWQVWSR